MGVKFTKIRCLFSFTKSPDVYKKELDGINKEISTIEQQKEAFEYQYNMINQIISSYTKLVYIMMALIFFFSTMPSTFLEYILFCGPLLVIYILIWGLKLSLKYYFAHESKRSSQKLHELLSRKKKIIEEVKEKINFSEAKDIIEEYGIVKRKNEFCKPNTTLAYTPMPATIRNNQSTTLAHNSVPSDIGTNQNNKFGGIQKRRDSSFDSVVKYILNEEKSTALICKYCNCHNGLALEEDFDFMSFRCCQCHTLNKAKSTAAPFAIKN